MLWSLSVLFGCAAAGEALRAFTGVPVPGTVLGMTLLFLGLCAAGREGRPVSLPAADGILPYLSLFFVAPGVYAGFKLVSLAAFWPAIAFGILGSSVLALVVTGRLVQALLAWQDRRRAVAGSSWIGRVL